MAIQFKNSTAYLVSEIFLAVGKFASKVSSANRWLRSVISRSQVSSGSPRATVSTHAAIATSDTNATKFESATARPSSGNDDVKGKHKLPPLPYSFSALDPFIDAQTLQLHHDIHHAVYVNGLNAALEKAPHLQDKTLEWLLLHLQQVPIRVRAQVRDNAGEHLNHSIMWHSMSPHAKTSTAKNTPSGKLALAIENSFGSFEEFQIKFEHAGNSLNGSGWVWLLYDANDAGSLQLLASSSNEESPVSQGYVPLLTIDIWEHAYSLKYVNRRDKYLRAWWKVANWSEVEAKYQRSLTNTAKRQHFN